jgi:sulfur-oxidizing protein SoxY
MDFSRRDTLALGLGAAALTMLPFRVNAAADDAIAAFTAENGNTVPIDVSAPGATAILLLAAGNPTPGVATYNFGELAGTQAASTRIRLAGTQDVVAIAKMSDGSFKRASKTVKVTIGGCGG